MSVRDVLVIFHFPKITTEDLFSCSYLNMHNTINVGASKYFLIFSSNSEAKVSELNLEKLYP